jgi:Tfp pilus assembly protein PilO
MDKLKQWIALSVAGALAILAAGWFLVISPKRTEAADLRTSAEESVSANAVLQTQIEVLKAKATDLPKEQARLARVAAKIPENPGLPALVRALVEASSASGVELVSITPGQPVLATGAAPAAGQPAAEGAVAPPAPAAPAGGAAGAGQLASIPVAISIVGGYFEVARFVGQLETLPRALRVNNLSLTPGASPTSGTADPAELAEGDSLTTTISGTVFMTAGSKPAAAPAAPAGSTTAAVPAPAPKN